MHAGRWRALGLGTGFVVVATAAQLLRQPGVATWNTIWAEDGAVYTTDALSHPALATLGRGYSGYIQLLPRLLALGTRLVPASGIAAYLAVSAAVVTSLLGLVVIRSADGWIRSRAIRWSLGFMVVLVPTASSEVNAAIANLIWPMLAVSFWAIASKHRRGVDLGLRVVVVALTALTSPVAVVLVPWALVVTALRRRRSDVVVTAALVGALGLQGLADLATTRVQQTPYWTLPDLMKEYVARVVASLVIGERWLGTLWLHHHRLLTVGSLAVVVGLAGLAALWTRDAAVAVTGDPVPAGEAAPVGVRARVAHLELDRWWVAGGAAVLSLANLVVTTVPRGTTSIGLIAFGRFDPAGSRYAVTPVVLLFSALAILVDGTGRVWLRSLFVVWTALVVISSLRLPTVRDQGPSWVAGVPAARATCRLHPTLAEVAVPISPAGGSWVVRVPCSRLRG